MSQFSRVRFPRFLSISSGLAVYDEVAAAGRLLLWLVRDEREGEVVKVVSNLTTVGGNLVVFLITTKRVLLLKVTDITSPFVVFEVVVTRRRDV